MRIVYGKGKPSEFRTQHVRGRKSSHSFEIIITPPQPNFLRQVPGVIIFISQSRKALLPFWLAAVVNGTAAHTTYIAYPACIRLDGEGVIQFSETRWLCHVMIRDERPRKVRDLFVFLLPGLYCAGKNAQINEKKGGRPHLGYKGLSHQYYNNCRTATHMKNKRSWLHKRENEKHALEISDFFYYVARLEGRSVRVWCAIKSICWKSDSYIIST